MHDEAAPTYVEMIENTARGHAFLKKHFNVAPKGTWQVCMLNKRRPLLPRCRAALGSRLPRPLRVTPPSHITFRVPP